MSTTENVSTSWRGQLGHVLRRSADRIDPDGAPRGTGFSFTFEVEEGIKVRSDGRGCPIVYFGKDTYERAHEESDTLWTKEDDG